MKTVHEGQQAPAFELHSINGKQFSLREALARGPVVAAFFKVSCPVCQFTFPFLERLFKAYQDPRVSFWAISQDDAKAAEKFRREYAITFPVLIDAEGYPVSNEYGLTNVPTYYLISPDGKIGIDSVGFGKRAIEQISEALARFLGRAPVPIFLPGEVIPSSKAG